jgi:hypothetical protein
MLRSPTPDTLHDYRSSHWRGVGNLHGPIEQRERVGQSTTGAVMHPKNSISTPNRFADVRHDFNPDSSIDHIVKRPSPRTK